MAASEQLSFPEVDNHMLYQEGLLAELALNLVIEEGGI